MKQMNTAKLLKNISALAILAATAPLYGATTYNWTGATSNNLNVDTNWAGGTQPAGIGSDQPSTPLADDVIVFDSATWTQKPRKLYTRTNRKWGSIVLNNGTIDWSNDNNNSGNYSFSGTNTLVVGDGDATAAVAQFNVTNWNHGGETGTKTYVINSDGTLSSARGGIHNWSNGASYDTVMRLVGGTVDITGQLQESQLTADMDDYVSFEAIGSTFTFTKGEVAGNFLNALDVTGAFGDSFRLGGSLNSGNAELQLTDGGASWTVNAIAVPEPSSAALLGLGGLALAFRRRR